MLVTPSDKHVVIVSQGIAKLAREISHLLLMVVISTKNCVQQYIYVFLKHLEEVFDSAAYFDMFHRAC